MIPNAPEVTSAFSLGGLGSGVEAQSFFPYPGGPSTQYLRTLVPNTIPLVDLGTRNLTI